MAGVTILTTKDPTHYYLINKLLATGKVTGVVFEKAQFKSELSILRSRVRRLGLRAVIDQVFLLLFTRLVEWRKNKNSLKRIFNDQPFDYLIKDVEAIETEDINSAKVKDFILAKSPSLVVVSGTSIIKPHLIRLVEGRMINIHVGITPEYRGAHGGFWAAYNGESEMVGVTVHMVDVGIDTGAILLQEKVAIDSSDTLMSIVYRQKKKGVDLVLRCLEQLEHGALRGYYKKRSLSKLYYSPGLTHYLKAKKTGLSPKLE